MYVIEVIPLAKAAPPSLTYRSTAQLSPGTLVRVELRKSLIQGIVVSCESVQDAKAMLKGVHYMLKASAPVATGTIAPQILTAATRIASRHATSLGGVLSCLLHEYLQHDLPVPHETFAHKGPGYTQLEYERDIWMRASEYKKLYEDMRLQNRSLVLVVPTTAELSFWKQYFAKEKPLVLSGAVAASKRRDTIAQAHTFEGLVLATPSFSWISPAALGAIVVERVSAGAYMLPKRPYLDMVYGLQELARARSCMCVLGDYPLPLEYRAVPEAPLAQRITKVPSVIDVRMPKDAQERPEGSWKAVPEVVLGRIKHVLTSGGRVLVLTARSGYASAVVCRDCGQAVTTSDGRPLSYGTLEGERVLRTSDGKKAAAQEVSCSRCESWNLLPLGVGQERVAEELVAAFPHAHVAHLTSDMLQAARSRSVIRTTLLESGTIVVGTESVLPHVLNVCGNSYPFDLAVIASADSLLSLPFWRARERFVRLCLLILSLAVDSVVVTRRPEDTAVGAVQGDPHFFEEEAALRRALHYPPFGTVVTIRIEGQERETGVVVRQLQDVLTEYSFTQTTNEQRGSKLVRTYAALLPQRILPESLVPRLTALPPWVRVRIDPESIW